MMSEVGQLNSGTTRAQVAAEVLGSAEYRGDLVASLFLRFRNRPPTNVEVNAFSGFLASGGTDEQLLAIIVSAGD